MIRFEPGTVIAKEHLRPFDLELAKAGHPLATYDGKEVRLFRVRSQHHFSWDVWAESGPSWDNDYGNEEWAKTYLRLAPLAIKDGRPLHVGDEIEQHFVSTLLTEDQYFWRRVKIMSHEAARTLGHWCWPESKELPADPELGR